MREILFRGKDPESGEWHYGYYVKRNDGDRGYLILEDYYLESYEIVKPETICQYTGLTDKNEKKIFEGDIVKISNDEIFEVKYEDGGFTAGLFLGDWDYGHVEVIGNIYDNPELLEVEEHE